MSARSLIPFKSRTVPLPSFVPARSGVLQRKCACGGTPGPSGECGTCRQKKLQRYSNNLPVLLPFAHHRSTASQVPPIVHEVLGSSGQPLDRPTRRAMESRFDHDFSQVRIHTDARAAQSAEAVNARAYTFGRHIAFAECAFSPETQEGRGLLAHELTHVLQQGLTETPSGTKVELGDQHDHLEEQAQAVEQTKSTLAPNELEFAGPAAQTLRKAPNKDDPAKAPPQPSPSGAPGWWPDADLWIQLAADDYQGCRFGDFVDLKTSAGKHATCEGPVSVCQGEPLVFIVTFIVDHVGTPHPSPKGFSTSALFELTTGKGERKVLFQRSDSAPKYIKPNLPLLPNFESNDYKIRMRVNESGKVRILLHLHEPTWNVDMTYDGMIDLIVGPCPPGTETGIYLLVPDPDKAPLVYKRITGNECWQDKGLVVSVWSDDYGYYYNGKNGRVRLPERP